MAVEFKFDEGLNCLLIRTFGELALSQFDSFLGVAKDLPALAPGHLRLTDLREVTKMPPAKDMYTVAHLMDALDQAIPPKRSALVARSDVTHSMARIFMALREPEEGIIGVHSNIFDALEWLELPLSEDPFAKGAWDAAQCIRFD